MNIDQYRKATPIISEYETISKLLSQLNKVDHMTLASNGVSVTLRAPVAYGAESYKAFYFSIVSSIEAYKLQLEEELEKL